MTIRDTLVGVRQAVSVRLDDDALRALRTLEATGLSRSDAIRTALMAAARGARHHARIAEEAARLETDEHDRAEMIAVADLMESLRAPR